MTTAPQPLRVGALRPNQLLHTYGVGAMADLPNLSVIMLGLDFWNLEHSIPVSEQRLLAAVRARLGRQVSSLHLPPYSPQTRDPYGPWSKVGVPVSLFPSWLRCTRCDRLGRADAGFFELVPHQFKPHLIRYVHGCFGVGAKRPSAVPARFVLACDNGHLDDFPWLYYVHRGSPPDAGHSLRIEEIGSTGEAANVRVSCTECSARRLMAEAFGVSAESSLPACRGRHPHLGKFEECTRPARTLVLGATNSWFPVQLRAFSLPQDQDPVDHLINEFWPHLQLLVSLPEDSAKKLMPTQIGWPELQPHGVDKVWSALKAYASRTRDATEQRDEIDLLTPEWRQFTSSAAADLPDFATRHGRVPPSASAWLDQLVLVSRLREVSALCGFTRVDAPEWQVENTPDDRQAPLSSSAPTWVPCAELRGEGFFLRFNEDAVRSWERRDAVRRRGASVLLPAHRTWCEQRRLGTGDWPGMRYLLLHTFAHVLIRELALDSGYSAAGIGERIYAREGTSPMAGVLLYTAAPDSEGTLGGLVSLGRADHLGPLLERALEAAELCSSDPLCADHDPRVHGRLYGAACHACLFASETSCERGNQYLDRALVVETLDSNGCGFFSQSR